MYALEALVPAERAHLEAEGLRAHAEYCFLASPCGMLVLHRRSGRNVQRNGEEPPEQLVSGLALDLTELGVGHQEEDGTFIAQSGRNTTDRTLLCIAPSTQSFLPFTLHDSVFPFALHVSVRPFALHVTV